VEHPQEHNILKRPDVLEKLLARNLGLVTKSQEMPIHGLVLFPDLKICKENNVYICQKRKEKI